MIDYLDYMKCSDGNTYQVVKNYMGNRFDMMICLKGDKVNEISTWLLNDCFTSGQPICIGIDDNKKLKYTNILSVYNCVGRFKSKYTGGVMNGITA